MTVSLSMYTRFQTQQAISMQYSKASMLHSPPSQATGHTCNNYNGSTTEISECSDNSLLMENETETYQLGSAHILLMSFSTLHCILVTLLALVKVIMIVAVQPFPAAPLIWTGYMECVQFSGGGFVGKELCKWKSCWNNYSLLSLRAKV